MLEQAVTKEALAKALKDRVKELKQCIVVDQSGGCGSAFQLYLVSPVFEGIKLIERHRMVQQALKTEMKSIHALSMKTWTPAQWDKKKGSLPKEVLQED